MAGQPRPVDRLVLHLTLVLLAGVAGSAATAFTLLLLDGRCLSYPDTGGCSPVRLHLARFLPAYASATAFLLGGVTGIRRIRARASLDTVITTDRLLLGTATFLVLTLH
jgi:hypothetical protein